MLDQNSEVTAIINGYKRAENVDNIIISLLNQSIKCKSIYVWWNDPKESKRSKFSKLGVVNNIVSEQNLGVWARFTFAINCETDYIVIFDDDTIPGFKWIENCLEHIHLGLLGTVGLVYHDHLHYMNHTRYGWPNPNPLPVRVDIVGHSWFFKRDWLSVYFRELHPTIGFNFFGEDIHFSYSLQKYLNIPTFVPPHPQNNWELWGSLDGMLGTDCHALSMSKDAASKWDIPFHHYLSKGFNLLCDG